MQEEWRPVPGYEELYEVSDRGRVRSLDRIVEYSSQRVRYNRYVRRGKILKTPANSGGYSCCALYKNGSRKDYEIHWLVAEAFIGPRPYGSLILHYDGNPSNNNLSNLRYGSNKDNGEDMIRHGRTSQGEKNANALLKSSDIPIIRSSHKSYKQLAEEFCVSISSIGMIKSKRSWRHI